MSFPSQRLNIACVAWRFWSGAQSNELGEGRETARRLGEGVGSNERKLVPALCARVFAASPLSSAPDKTATLRRLDRTLF